MLSELINLKQQENLRNIAYLLLSASHKKTDIFDSLYEKLGIAIFFFHYSRASGDTVYEEKASGLLDEIYHIQYIPNDRINEFLWIGIKIEYLAQHGFVRANTNEILENFDQLIHMGSRQHFRQNLL
jgi:hypothetical protein